MWHFPTSGVAVKAASLRSGEAASALALEAELLHKAGPHRHVVGLHSTFLGARQRASASSAPKGFLKAV